MTEAMHLFLPGNVADSSAGVLNVLLAVHDLPNRFGFGALRVPNVDSENDRISSRVVIEDSLHRRVRQDSAVPVQILVDPDSWECRWQCPGCHHVAQVDMHISSVEIAHFSGTDVRGP